MSVWQQEGGDIKAEIILVVVNLNNIVGHALHLVRSAQMTAFT